VWANEAVGDSLVVQNAAGKDIIRATATSGVAQNAFAINEWVEGIILLTLTSGEITLFPGAGK
jgi:hypothetical protein